MSLTLFTNSTLIVSDSAATLASVFLKCISHTPSPLVLSFACNPPSPDTPMSCPFVAFNSLFNCYFLSAASLTMPLKISAPAPTPSPIPLTLSCFSSQCLTPTKALYDLSVSNVSCLPPTEYTLHEFRDLCPSRSVWLYPQ